MDPELKANFLERVRTLKTTLKDDGGFHQDDEARSSYVVLLTLEGAVMFGDVVELGDLCVEYCRVKERQATEAN